MILSNTTVGVIAVRWCVGGGDGNAVLPRLGPWHSFVLGQALGLLSVPIKVLPWCGSQCQAGPYMSALFATIGMAIAGPAGIMYTAAALKATDLAGAQSALVMVSTVISNTAPMFWAALFFGDRAMMTGGYMLATLMNGATLATAIVLLPRKLPPSANNQCKTTRADDGVGGMASKVAPLHSIDRS